jgi:hypothetical protein
VINPRSMAVLIRDRAANQFEDKTRDVSEIRTEGQRIEIVFIRSNKTFGYGQDRVRILRNPQRYALREGERVEVNGSAWESATEVWTFTGTGGAWSRIFYRTQAGEDYRTYPASQVRVITFFRSAAISVSARQWRKL